MTEEEGQGEADALLQKDSKSDVIDEKVAEEVGPGKTDALPETESVFEAVAVPEITSLLEGEPLLEADEQCKSVAVGVSLVLEEPLAVAEGQGEAVALGVSLVMEEPLEVTQVNEE